MKSNVLAHLLCCALFLALPVVQAQTYYHYEPATFGPADADHPDLAISTEGWAQLAFESDGVVATIRMDVILSDALFPMPDPLPVGPGSAPRICWTPAGFVVAMLADDAVVSYRQTYMDQWDTANPLTLAPGGVVTGLDLCGDPDPWSDRWALLSVDTFDGAVGRVLYAELGSSGWSALETVATTSSVPPGSRIVLHDDGVEVWYLDGPEVPSLRRCRRSFDGWDAPVAIPDQPVAGEFDVFAGTDGAVDVLGLGLQPTCPCGTVHHLHAGPDGTWDSSLNLTVDYGTYDWPMSPRLGAAPEGPVHAFWSQLSSDSALQPQQRSLEYRILEDGTWVDAGDFLDHQSTQGIGARVALSVSEYDDPILAWTRRDTLGGVPYPQQIWVARTFSTSGVAPSPAPSAIGISAHPNPFNPSVAFTIDAPAGPATVSVHDLRGVLVRRWSVVSSGRPATLHWDGRDDAGRDMPSGTYFAQLRAAEMKRSLKLTLVR